MASDWPPTLSPEHEQALLALASDYSLSHGLVLRPLPSPADHAISQTSAIHAPYSLFPSPFPARLFQQARDLQPLYNQLYAAITANDQFLEEVVGGAVAKVDEFQGRLYDIWKTVKQEGIRQPISLGLFRSDYLIHAPSENKDTWELKQVEFNTISSSFGALSTRVGEMHRYLLSSGLYPSHPSLTPPSLPQNGALAGLAAGLAAAHRAYGKDDAVVLMVIQDNERNAFDQRLIEWEVVAKHGIRLLRVPFSQLRTTLSLAPSSSDSTSPAPHSLLYTPPHPFPSSSPSAATPTPVEVSLVYYRTAYSPTDYYTPAEWATRLLIERSRAIKCPSVAMQLAGAKKVQQVLSLPHQLERCVPGAAAAERAQLRESFTGLWPMDDSDEGREGQRRARDECEGYVLKPQREGGGNNIYRGDIPPFLDALAAQDEQKVEGEPKGREGYILMSLIEPPQGMEQVLVKGGEAQGRRADVVSELGVYGVVLVDEEQGTVIRNETVGHLLRTKGRESDEGGVAVGFSVIDSPWLI